MVQRLVRAIGLFCLQVLPLEGAADAVLGGGQVVFDADFDQRHLVAPGRLVDIAYEDLEAKPVQVMREIYGTLGLPGFEAYLPWLQAYLDTLRGYRKNEFPELAPDLKLRV